MTDERCVGCEGDFPDDEAGWLCEGCGKALCDRCVKLGIRRTVVCGVCAEEEQLEGPETDDA